MLRMVGTCHLLTFHLLTFHLLTFHLLTFHLLLQAVPSSSGPSAPSFFATSRPPYPLHPPRTYASFGQHYGARLAI